MTHSHKDLISVKEAAARLHISTHTIYQWISTGRLTEKHGLVTIGRRRQLHWPTLQAAMRRGEL